MTKYVKVEVFVPEDYVVNIANALNAKDIIREGCYDYVFGVSNVKGHFRPIDGANPFSGKIGVVNEVDEVKMEFRIKYEDINEVKKIIEREHPYEEPVVNYIALID